MFNSIRRVLSYNDVLLVPRNSMLEHKSDASLLYDYDEDANGSSLIPIINAPMNSFSTPSLLNHLHYKSNMPITIHRWFKNADEQIEYFEKISLDNISRNNEFIFFSVGAVAKWKDWIDQIIDFCKDNYTSILIDMANGDTKACLDTIEYITNKNQYINIMAGNVATRSGFSRLQDAGAKFIRTGIGGGSCCETRRYEACGLPTLTSIFDCREVKNENTYLVADGGIEYTGDILKAMAAGADMVMCGKLFAGTSLANGELKYDKLGNAAYKVYYGQASREANIQLGKTPGEYSIEGAKGLVKYTGETEQVVKEILANLQTGLSYYFGCTNWNDFKRKAKFVEITQNGWEESKSRLIEE